MDDAHALNSTACLQGEPIDWDDVLAASMVAAGARASSASSSTRGSTGLPGSGPKPGAEPYVDLVAKTQRDVLLMVRHLELPCTMLCWHNRTRQAKVSADG
jgi:hypothetical protein